MNTQRRLARGALLTLAVSWLTLAGCSGTKIPEPADPEKARAALRSALDVWKDGGTPTALQSASPPIRVADDDWVAGLRLHNYEIQDQGEEVGNSLHVTVVLHLVNDSDAPMNPITVTYQVTTSPRLEVARYDPSN
jgi:hypothetical protein